MVGDVDVNVNVHAASEREPAVDTRVTTLISAR